MLSQRVLAQVIHADAAGRRGIKLEPAPPLRAPSGHEVKAYRFTDVPKVGLNPVNKYATPLGTYWYPMYDEDDEKAVAQLNVEFGGDRKYVIEAIVDLRRVVVLDDVTESEFERYQRLLLKQITRVSGAKPMKPAIVLRQATEKAQAEAKTSGSKKEYWGRALWYLINNLSHALTAYRQTKDSVRTATAIFNRLARLLDIDGFLNWSDWHVSRSEKSGAKRFPIIHPQEPRQMVLFTNDPIVESQVISSSQLEKRGLAGLDPLAADVPLTAVQTVASKRGTPADILIRLADYAESSVRRLVAANPSTPPEVLERLARDRESTVRHAVAANRLTAPALLDRMSILDKSDGVRAEIAQNPSTPPEALERLWSVYSLLTDPDSESKRPPQETLDLFSALAGNPSTPPAVLEKLASDRAMHHSIASNPSTPPAVLERIALEKTNSDWGRLRYVTNALAIENPNFSQESFKKLSRDMLVEIVNDTTKASLLTRLADHVDEKIRLAVAGREIAPIAVLRRLAGDDDKYVRLAVAHNRSTPIAALKRLAADLSPIRARVAGNARTPASILAVLATDDHKDVRLEAASNVRTPPEALDRLARREGDDEALYFQVALNPSTPTSTLDHLATNASRSIRNAVTEHPKSSRETLERLATTDEDDVIRRHARDELKKRFSASGSYVSAKKKITRQDAKRMERDAKKHKNWKKKWTEVTQQPKKSPKGSWVGRATFEWVTGTDKGTKRSRPITLGDAATLTIRGGKLIVRPKGGQEYEYGDEESRKAAEAEQKRKQGKSPIDGLDTVQDLKKELLDNFETSLEMVDKFVRRERKRAKEGTTAASTSLGARLDAVVETLSGLRLPTPTVLALEVAASVLHARAAGINVFHGTTNKFARSILKNGLVRNAKNKVWDVDLDHGYSPNRVTYGGVYLTTNFMTAYSSAGNALRKLGGTGRLIIEARVQAKAAIGDEDSYHGPVDRFFNQAFGYSPNDFHIARAYLDPEEVAELRIKFASLFTDYAIQRGWVTAKNPKLRDAAEAMFDAALTRYASLPEKGSSYTVDTLWEKAGRSPPTKEEGNRVYREALDRLTRVTKGQAYKEREGFTHSLRLVDDDIDFKGANRIVSVVEIFDGKGEVPSRAKVLYGNPKNILEGIRQNIGPNVEVAVVSPRMLSSAKEEQARLDATVERLSSLRLPTPTLLALEAAASMLHASASFSVSLIPTDEWLAKNPEESWDWHIQRTILSKLPASAKTWDSKYDADARAALYGIFQRLMESLVGNDDLPLKEVTKAAFIEFRYLNPDDLIHRGDRVYSSEKLADVIRSGKDLAPIQAGADGPNSKVRVLDGHHRMRAYSLAKRSMPAWVGWVGAGKPATLTVSFDMTREAARE